MDNTKSENADKKTEINIKQLASGKAKLTAHIYGSVYEKEYPDITLAVVAAEEILEFEGGKRNDDKEKE